MDGWTLVIHHALHLFTFAELSGILKVRYDPPENTQIIGIPGSGKEKRRDRPRPGERGFDV